MSKALTLSDIYGINQSNLAMDIASKFNEWDNLKTVAKNNWKDLQSYLNAISTKDTINNQLPFRNSTTLPKIGQVYEQLVSLTYNMKFSTEDWASFESRSREDTKIKTKKMMTFFIREILNDSGFYNTALNLDQDLYIYGNSFARVSYENSEVKKDKFTQNMVEVGYNGAKLERISPYDIVFDPTATSFENTPKIIRSLITYPELVKRMNTSLEVFDKEAIELIKMSRSRLSRCSIDSFKDKTFQMSGFGTLRDYLKSGVVELLEFVGDIFIQETGEILENRSIIIVDRHIVLLNKQNDYSIGENKIFQNRDIVKTDNLWGESRLLKLMGMQFMIDKYNNGKADALDFILNPPLKIKGEVSDFNYMPGEIIHMDRDSDINPMLINYQILQTDFGIDKYMFLMEQFAGLPSNLMGFKTKGEKTLGEVQMLESSAMRQFNVKVQSQERMFWQPILNSMFAITKINMPLTKVIKYVGKQGSEYYKTIRKSELEVTGNYKAVGSIRFDKNLKILNNIMTYLNLLNNPKAEPHVSMLNLLELVGEITGLTDRKIIAENIGIDELSNVEVYKAQVSQFVQSQLALMTQPTQQEKDLEQASQLDIDSFMKSVSNELLNNNNPEE